MSLPFFYIKEFDPSQKSIDLDEDTSRHIVSVLRMKKGEQVQLTDGKGNLLLCSIHSDHKKHCRVEVLQTSSHQPTNRKITIAISLLKNSSRFEWFLEKATEIGINRIIPLVCDRTEKQKFREERLQQILVSAMLQSQQAWIPQLENPIAYKMLFDVEEIKNSSQKFIAHCIEDPGPPNRWEKRNLSDLVNESLPSQLILIGPEGDFTPGEIELAISNHFDAVSLGETRLRAETAGVVAAAILKNV